MIRQRTIAGVFCAILLFLAPAGRCAAAPAAPVLQIDAPTQLALADHHFDDGDNISALVEYQRFLYFFKDNEKAPYARYRVGRCQMRLHQAKKALHTFQAITRTGDDAPFSVKSWFEIANVYLLLGDRENAVITLNNMLLLYPAPDVRDRIYERLGWLRLEDGQWEAAEAAFLSIPSDRGLPFHRDALIAALRQTPRLPHKDPATAGLLSIIPGGGQLYCGRYRDAIVAFIVNGGLIWASAEAFGNDLPALGGVIGFVGFGFYAGNIYGAVGDAHKFNDWEYRRFVNGLKENFAPDWQSRSTAPGTGPVLAFSIPF